VPEREGAGRTEGERDRAERDETMPDQQHEKTQREIYDDLLAELAAGTHTWNDRGVITHDVFSGVGSQAGKLVVAVQYGPRFGDLALGGHLVEYAFDPEQLEDVPAPAVGKSARRR
jgi:hypothetical protein